MGAFGECGNGGCGLPARMSADSRLSGRPIEPVRLEPGMSVESLVECYAGMGYNARRLAELADWIVLRQR